jgi:hypothetical protein
MLAANIRAVLRVLMRCPLTRAAVFLRLAVCAAVFVPQLALLVRAAQAVAPDEFAVMELVMFVYHRSPSSPGGVLASLGQFTF